MSSLQNLVLKDSKNDRHSKDVPLPYQKPLPSNVLWRNPQKPNSNLLHQFQIREGKLLKQDFLQLIRVATRVLSMEPNVLQLSDPITLVGDIHGQYYDLHTLLNEGGFPDTSQQTKYLFLGDYVDRGHFSTEVITLLLCMKIEFPDKIFLLRGNHESAYCTVNYGFQAEILRKYDQEVYNALLECFNCLPLIAVLNGRFAAMHAGISPEIQDLQQVNQINRKMEVPTSGMICDIVWSDPTENNPHSPFSFNDNRGCSFLYNQNSVQDFLHRNNLSCIIRAHEVKQLGFDQQFMNQNNLPQVITIFSAPFYGKQYQNLGAVIKMSQNQINFQQYRFNNDEPFFYEFKNPVIQKYDNVFKWSMPFVAEQITKIAIDLLSQTISAEQEQKIDRDIQSFERRVKGANSVPFLEEVEVQPEFNQRRTPTVVNSQFRQYNGQPQNEQPKNLGFYGQQVPTNQNLQRQNQQPQYQSHPTFQSYQPYQNRYTQPKNQGYNQQQQYRQSIPQNQLYSQPKTQQSVFSQSNQQRYNLPQNNIQQAFHQQSQIKRQNSQIISLADQKFDFFNVLDPASQDMNQRIRELEKAKQRFQQQNQQTLNMLKSISQSNNMHQDVKSFDPDRFRQQVKKDQIYEGRFF